jgi:hypothetical protein
MGILNDAGRDVETRRLLARADSGSGRDGSEELDDPPPGAIDRNDEAPEEEDDLDEDDVEEVHTTSPMMRSSFVANSALPDSPLQQHRTPSNLASRHRMTPERESGDSESESSAARQLLSERMTHIRPFSGIDESDELERPLPKRPRTESRAGSVERRMWDNRPTVEEPSDTSPDPLAEDSRSPHSSDSDPDKQDLPGEPTTTKDPALEESHDEDENGGDDDDDDASEYAVQAILAHSYQDGIKYYLVQWEGYEEATDWLSEDALEGAADMVADYNESVRSRKKRKHLK